MCASPVTCLTRRALGALIILLGARIAEWIPFVGGFLSWLILVGSFGFAVAAILLARRQAVAEQVMAEPVDIAAGV